MTISCLFIAALFIPYSLATLVEAGADGETSEVRVSRGTIVRGEGEVVIDSRGGIDGGAPSESESALLETHGGEVTLESCSVTDPSTGITFPQENVQPKEGDLYVRITWDSDAVKWSRPGKVFSNKIIGQTRTEYDPNEFFMLEVCRAKSYFALQSRCDLIGKRLLSWRNCIGGSWQEPDETDERFADAGTALEAMDEWAKGRSRQPVLEKWLGFLGQDANMEEFAVRLEREESLTDEEVAEIKKIKQARKVRFHEDDRIYKNQRREFMLENLAQDGKMNADIDAVYRKARTRGQKLRAEFAEYEAAYAYVTMEKASSHSREVKRTDAMRRLRDAMNNAPQVGSDQCQMRTGVTSHYIMADLTIDLTWDTSGL